MLKKYLPLIAFLLFISCHSSTSTESGSIAEPVVSNEPPAITYTILKTFPHDNKSYTEGFLVHNGKLYESSGAPEGIEYTRSIFGVVDSTTGNIDVKIKLDREKYFGEGVVFLKGKIYQLTYKNQVGFIYNEKTFKNIGRFAFPTVEGWGMTTDGTSLIMSDGTSNLTYLDPNTFKTVRILGVTNNNGPVGNLNELEFIKGSLFANIYESTDIVRIDPQTGKVTGKADFSSLDKEVKTKYPDAEYLNGIAYDSTKDIIYITGKLWPNIYELRFNN